MSQTQPFVREDIQYKTEDHSFRSLDEYANAKYEITKEWLRPSLIQNRGERTLANVGCGGGEFNLAMSSFGIPIIACEPERSAYELARKNCREVSSIRIENMGLESFARATPPVDFLVMHDVLEHIEDEAAAVQCISKLLKRGGEAVISVPALQFLFGIHDIQLGHFRRYRKSRLIELFSPEFTILRSRYYGSLFIPVTLIFSRILRKPYPTQAVTSQLWKQKLFRAFCQIQRMIPEPIGTSVLIHLKKK